MDNTINIYDILSSLENISDLYPNKISLTTLKEEMSKAPIVKEAQSVTDKNDKQRKNEVENFSISLVAKNDVSLSWGNEEANIYILGTVRDKLFCKSSELFRNILKNGMKLGEDKAFCESVSIKLDRDISKYKYILCLGSEAKKLLEDDKSITLQASILFKYRESIIMPTYSISEVNNDKNIKRLFWNDLQEFIKGIG